MLISLKQLSIGFGSQSGKTWIHTAGVSTNWTELFTYVASQENFTSAMADAASSIVNYFRNKGVIVFINVLANISKSCDCAGASAPEPKIHNMGIMASTDPVAIDKACFDMIKNNPDNGTEEWLKQVNDKVGENTLKVAEELGIGTQDYNLINVDESKEEEKEEEEEENKDDKDKNNKIESSYLWLYITLGIVGIIIIGIVGIILFLKCRKVKDEDLIAKINEE